MKRLGRDPLAPLRRPPETCSICGATTTRALHYQGALACPLCQRPEPRPVTVKALEEEERVWVH